MHIPKILSIGLALCFMVPCLGADYSLNSAVEAAGKLMPTDGPKEFSLFNLPEPKAKPKQLLVTLRQARDQKVCLAICSPKLGYVRDLLQGALKAAKGEKFDGLYLIIVADQMDAAGFDEMLKGRGIKAKYGVFE